MTPDGQKVLKLIAGGDEIQWRPDGPTDMHYTTVIEPLTVSHLKARAPGDVQSIGDTKTVSFIEDVNLDALPANLQILAHEPGNKLSSQRPGNVCAGKWYVDGAIHRVVQIRIFTAEKWPDKLNLSGHCY